MQITAKITRPLAVPSTDDASTNAALNCDFAIDYVNHTVKIQMGQFGETDTSYVRFSSTVDFNNFYPSDNAIGLTSSLALVAALIATAF